MVLLQECTAILPAKEKAILLKKSPCNYKEIALDVGYDIGAVHRGPEILSVNGYTAIREYGGIAMNLSNRQLSILSFILNHPKGVHGSELASYQGISLRTLQMEIKGINEGLPDRQRLKSLGRSGYIAEGFTEEDKLEISQIMEGIYTRKAPAERSNAILSVLIFEKDYISMESLANKLYLSKSAIFKEFENAKVLQDYVEISRQKGVRVSAPESVKRNILSKTFDKEAAYCYDASLKEEYERLNAVLKSILPEAFLTHKYMVSGEAMRSFRRHLIITIMRKKRGFEIERKERPILISSLMKEIIGQLQLLTRLEFSPDDISDLQIKLNGLTAFAKWIPENRLNYFFPYKVRLKRFLEELQIKFGLSVEFTPEEEKRFLLYILKLADRKEGSHRDSNFLKREIHRRYPLSVHLIRECFEHHFEEKLPETEVSNLALYLASKLDKPREFLECVLISDRNPSVLYHMEAQIRSRYSEWIRHIEIVPDYCYTKNLNYYRDKIALTTDETIALTMQDMILVKPFLTEKNHQEISNRIQIKLQKMQNDRFSKSLAAYGKEDPYICRKTYKDMEDFLNDTGEQKTDCGYEFVMDSNVILFPKIYYDDKPNEIRVYLMQYPFNYRHTSVHMAVFSDYQAKSMQMLKFYDCIRTLLDPHQIRNIEKKYLD